MYIEKLIVNDSVDDFQEYEWIFQAVKAAFIEQEQKQIIFIFRIPFLGEFTRVLTRNWKGEDNMNL